MKLLAQFDLDIFPPTANHIQQSTRSGRRYDTAEYKDFKANFTEMVGDRLKPLAKYDGQRLVMEITYYWKGWLTKDGRIRKKRDVTNRIKALEDAIFKAIGIDDSLNWWVTVKKEFPTGQRDKFVEVEIYQLESLK